MNTYGTLIENIPTEQEVYTSKIKQQIYEEFTAYFNNLTFYKTEDKGPYSIYVAKINCQLCVLKKYLLAFVQRDNNPVNTAKLLSELKWVCFQTQLSTTIYKLPESSYAKKNTPFFASKINVVSRTPQKVTYSVENLPLIVELLPKNTRDKDYNKYEYADQGTLKHAIETFKTIITFQK